MNGLLIDNWFMEGFFRDYYTTRNITNKLPNSINDFLEAIILWDDIYLLDNPPDYSVSRIRFYDILTLAYPFSRAASDFFLSKTFGERIKKLHKDQIEGYDNMVDIALDWYLSSNVLKYSSLVAERAIFYDLLSNSMGLSYMPALKRADFLREVDYSSLINSNKYLHKVYYTRKDVVKKMDKYINEYYKELNNKIGTNKIKFDIPILADYVISNAKTPEMMIQTALQIRDSKPAKQFREWMDAFEFQVNKKGNFVELKHCLDALPQIVDEFKDFKAPRLFELSIGLSPAINIPIELPGKRNKVVHMTFLRNLTKFALTQRHT